MTVNEYLKSEEDGGDKVFHAKEAFGTNDVS